ncbi:MAG: YafY family transcriptional regulator [Actinobacteria bacterium]|nr:YafY family transcriptional regulator [Actinomycetota bacterium]
MRASRLLSILLTLTVRDQVSAAELAAELEVSLRTIYRDVEALSAAGVPVYATRGRTGGIRLLDGYRTRLTGLTAGEADTLFLAGVPGAAADLGLGSVLAATQLKLLAALPAELRERAARIRETFYLDAPGWLRETDAPPFLATIAEAAWTHQRVDVRYERANRAVVARRLDPLGLVLKAGAWYLVATVPGDDRGPRTYRVSRVQAAAVLEETFERPADFDLEAFWVEYQRGYERRVYRETALVRLSPAGRELLFLLGPIAARRARAGLGEPDGEGWATTTVPIESVRHGHHALLQFGEHADVLEPAELRGLIAASAAAITARNQE